jgi:hypothetical protein
MTIQPLPIIGSYDKQRFPQFGPEDCANWYITKAESGKKKVALYPSMGRHHVRAGEQNRLIFNSEPRGLFRTVNYWYVVVNNSIFRIDTNYNMVEISSNSLQTLQGNIFFTYIVAVNITFAVFVDGQKMYVYREPDSVSLGQFYTVSDPNAPPNPTFVATFGNRIVASNVNSSQFYLSQIFLGGATFDPATCFTIAGAPVFAQEVGIIRQFAVVNSTLYIFTDFNVGIWNENPSLLVPAGGSAPVTFPWKKNTTYDWQFGMADPMSLDVAFNRMVWVAQNKDGLFQVMTSQGGLPEKISTKAIDVLFQKYSNAGPDNPFLARNTAGFLYQYENTIFYRLSAGDYDDTGILDQLLTSNSIEFSFDTGSWERCIEANGGRNRIQRHVFFNKKHFVTVDRDSTVYEMSGAFYDNEITNPLEPDPQEMDAYMSEPFRYERVTPIISEDDYSEFITDYVEVDFVFGDSTFIHTDTPFQDTVFIIDEAPDTSGDPIFVVTEVDQNIFVIKEATNNPELDSQTYNKLFKPHIELYFSNDGGISYFPADVREFSQLGVYQWRMRWYQLGASRNRVYKLICVSPAPIVILGGVMNKRRVSGGAN